jgi:hypothetical protein
MALKRLSETSEVDILKYLKCYEKDGGVDRNSEDQTCSRILLE